VACRRRRRTGWHSLELCGLGNRNLGPQVTQEIIQLSSN
jgi:hypothetical protein